MNADSKLILSRKEQKMKKRIKINRGVIILSLFFALLIVYGTATVAVNSMNERMIKELALSYMEAYSAHAEIPFVQEGGISDHNKLQNNVNKLSIPMKESMESFFVDSESAEAVFKGNEAFYEYCLENGYQLSGVEMECDFEFSSVYSGFEIDFTSMSTASVRFYVDCTFNFNSEISSGNGYYEMRFEKVNGEWLIVYADSYYDCDMFWNL